MNAELAAEQHAKATLVEILASTEVPHGKIKRWKSKADNMYYWKCFCGFGMRYANEQAMRTGSINHRMSKHKGMVPGDVESG